MRNRFRAAMVYILALCVQSGAVAQESLLTPEGLATLGYFKYWELGLDLGRAREVSGAHVVDDTLYVLTDSGDAHAVHAEAGLSRWAQNITSSVYPVYPPTHFATPDGRDLVVLTTSPRTVILDRYLGDMVADMPIQKAAVGSAVASDDRIFFGSSDGHLYAMRWTDPRTNVAVMLWRVMSGGPPSGAPVLINQGDDLVFASQGGSVYSCTAPTKILNWRAQTNGPIIAQVAVDGPGVFAASADRSLYRFNLISGAQEWRARFPEPLNDGPVVTGGIVFQYCAGEGIIALDAERGEPLWQQREARQFVCRGIEHVVLITELRELLKVDVNSGNVRARVRLPSNAVTVTNVHDDTIYLVSHAGSVFCAKPSGTPHLTPEQMAVARRELRDPDPRPSGARAVEMPPRRPDEPGVIDPADPLRSPGDRGEQSPE